MVLDNDTSNGLSAVTVGTSGNETDPPLAGVTLQVDNFTTGVIRVDNGLLADAGFDLEAFIRDKFAKRFYRGVSNLVVNGNAGNVASLTSAYSTSFASSTTASTLSYAW